MERNYPLFWIFLASLYATLLNLLGMYQEVNTVYTLTKSVYMRIILLRLELAVAEQRIMFIG